MMRAKKQELEKFVQGMAFSCGVSAYDATRMRAKGIEWMIDRYLTHAEQLKSLLAAFPEDRTEILDQARAGVRANRRITKGIN